MVETEQREYPTPPAEKPAPAPEAASAPAGGAEPVRFTKRIRQYGETACAAAAFAIVPLLPRGAILGLARVAGGFGYYLSRRLRRIALANLEAALGTALGEAERRRVARRAFQHVGLVLLDLFWFSRFRRRRLRRWVTLDPEFERALAVAPAVAVTAHFGNWELLGQSVALRGRGIVSVAAPLQNPAVDRMLTRTRQQGGQQIVPKRGALRALLRAVRGPNWVALVMDQNTRPDEGGIFVDLFGVPAAMSTAAAALVRKTGVPLFFCLSVHSGGGRYRAMQRTVPVRPEDSVADITQTLASLMEEGIRSYPEQWLWMYKRWKFIPGGAPAERFPFYAQPAGNGESQAEGDVAS